MRISATVLLVLFLILNPVSGQMPAPNIEDTAKYYGYDYGCAGIATAMLEALPFLNLSERNQTMEAVELCLERLWNARSTYNGQVYAAWSKSTENEIIYPGHKYGAAGIIDAFLNYYTATGNTTWLERSLQSYNSLMDQAINKTTLPHWGYAYDLPSDPYAIPITDLKYGAAGVLQLNLRLFQVTGNQTLLLEGEKIIEWLKMTTHLREIDGVNYNVFGWYLLENSKPPIVNAFEYGLSGLAPLLYQYGVEMGSPTVMNLAREQALYLTAIQNENGSWPYSDLDDAIIAGYDQGMAGILHGLFAMKNIQGTNEYDSTIRKGIDYLMDVMVENSTHFGWLSSKTDPIFYNNLAHGLSGILLVLAELDEFLTPNEKDVIIRAIEHLVNSQTLVFQNNGENALLLQNPWLPEGIFDFSYADGLAGFLHFLSSINQTYSSRTPLDISASIRYATSTLRAFQGNDGLWNKQRDLSPFVSSLGHFTERKETSSTITPTTSVPLQILMPALIMVEILLYKRKTKSRPFKKIS